MLRVVVLRRSIGLDYFLLFHWSLDWIGLVLVRLVNNLTVLLLKHVLVFELGAVT
jgi:hypothetical protein